LNIEFKKNGFKVVRNFYNVDSHTEKVPDLYKYLLDSKHLATMDIQVVNAHAFYNNIEVSKTQIKALSKLEEETDLKLFPTYSYARIYNKDCVLQPHIDRPACEISVTINIGHAGSKSWPIFIKDFSGKSHEVSLDPGDGLIYHGCELEHWRERADENVVEQAQMFLHYVRQDGQFESYIYDNPYQETQAPQKKKNLFKRIFNK
jgi:hypothetical protein